METNRIADLIGLASASAPVAGRAETKERSAESNSARQLGERVSGVNLQNAPEIKDAAEGPAATLRRPKH